MHRAQVLDRRRGLDAECDLRPKRLLPTVLEDEGGSGCPNRTDHLLVAATPEWIVRGARRADPEGKAKGQSS